jgi:hypothetical protein
MSLDPKIDNDLFLPVSIGEALDKLSILYIKLDKITDYRRDNVKIEYDMLYEKLEPYVKSSQKYYDMLKKTNEYIWKLMDILRDEMNIEDTEYTKLCKETVISNDVRFRIKNKINNLLNSRLKEQKGYKVLSILFDFTDYTGNYELLIKPLIYYSILYDEIHVKSEDQLLIKFITNEFNKTIIIIDKDSDNHIEYLNIFNIGYNTKTIENIYHKLNINSFDIDKFI